MNNVCGKQQSINGDDLWFSEVVRLMERKMGFAPLQSSHSYTFLWWQPCLQSWPQEKANVFSIIFILYPEEIRSREWANED